MTKIWTMSDLHQEWPQNHFDPAAAAPDSFHVVVVAGDVSSPLTSALLWLNERFAGCRVVYTPGNHDFWRMNNDDRYNYQDVVAAGRDIASNYGIDLLIEGESVVVGDTRFVGGVLWTDYACRPSFMSIADAMGEAKRRMNDFKYIRWMGNKSKHKIEPRDVLRLHRETKARMAAILTEPFDGDTVVITHHAPHAGSLGCPVEVFDVPWAYASAGLGSLIEEADLWVHGHLHGQVDYTVGETRILANARGFADEKSALVFKPDLVVEIGKPEYAFEVRM